VSLKLSKNTQYTHRTNRMPASERDKINIHTSYFRTCSRRAYIFPKLCMMIARRAPILKGVSQSN